MRGAERCYYAGPFAAEIVRLNRSVVQPHNRITLEFTIRFSNLGREPLILGYKSRSSVGVDDVGNRYLTTRAGVRDNTVRGIGVVTGQSADASFRLDPGKARTGTFAVRFQAGRRQVGTRYAFDATLVELELLPSNQVRTGREHALGFRDVTPGVWSASSIVEGLLNSLIGGAKKP